MGSVRKKKIFSLNTHMLNIYVCTHMCLRVCVCVSICYMWMDPVGERKLWIFTGIPITIRYVRFPRVLSCVRQRSQTSNARLIWPKFQPHFNFHLPRIQHYNKDTAMSKNFIFFLSLSLSFASFSFCSSSSTSSSLSCCPSFLFPPSNFLHLFAQASSENRERVE